MKIRDGFVSNSSSSSFVVYMKDKHDFKGETEDMLSLEDVTKLEKYGFNPVKDDKRIHEFTYGVTCNEDDVIEFLLKNKIQFEAECHYGHYHVFYDKEKNIVIEAWNYGCEISTYGIDSILLDIKDQSRYQTPVKIMTREEWLAENSL